MSRPPHPPQTIFTTRQLLHAGHTRESLRAAMSRGELVRARRGVYATPDAPPDLRRAATVGGRATSVSALRHWSVWAPTDDRLHVRVPPQASRLRDPDTRHPLEPRRDIVVHWTGDRLSPLADPSVESIPSALAALSRHHPLTHVVAAMDSALHQQLAFRSELAHAFVAAGPSLRRALALADQRAESGTESVARIRLAQAGIETEGQVRFGRYRVDLLIDGWLAVELDSREFHGSGEQSTRDYERDAVLTLRGLHVMHFSYGQVFHHWPDTVATIRTALTAGRAALTTR